MQRTPRVHFTPSSRHSSPISLIHLAASHGGARTPAPSPSDGRRRRRPARARDPGACLSPAGAGAEPPSSAPASARPGDLGVRQRAAALLAPLLLPRPRRPRQAQDPRQPRRRGRRDRLGPARRGAPGAELLRRRRPRVPRRRAAGLHRPRRLAAPARFAQHEGETFD